MKKFAVHITRLFAVLLPLTLAAQKKLTEATITYDIIINNNDVKPQGSDMLDGATSVIYLKGNSSRSEMKSSLGTTTTIIDGKTGNVTMLKNYGQQKYMIKYTPEDWKESNKKNDSVTFTYYNEFKTIQNYNCQKAIGKINDSTSFTVYFTRDLVPVNKEFDYLNKNLPGLALEYESVRKNKIVTYRVSDISFDLVPQSKFDLPKSGYRVMTYQESKGGGN